MPGPCCSEEVQCERGGGRAVLRARVYPARAVSLAGTSLLDPRSLRKGGLGHLVQRPEQRNTHAGTAQPFPCQRTMRSGPPSGPRASNVLREASPFSGAPGLGHGFSEDEEELPSLAFLLGLHHSLLPWGLPQSPVPASGLVCTAGQRAQKASQAPFPQRIGLSSGPLEAAKSRKRARCGGLAAAENLARPRADLRGSGRHTLALGLVDPSQPKRSRCDPRRKWHCSQ